MDFDAVVLARIQFAFTVSFHFLFPALTIGLASYLAVLEGLWLYTRRSIYFDLFNYWIKIFALNFGMGVVSGLVMSYQFGTNWSVFSDRTGAVLGPLMGYEVLTAFFLEAGFLGIMLFGLRQVGSKLHFGATIMVAIGTLLSSFWILAANSWMQTPQGHSIAANGQFVVEDWWKVIFNPSFPYRLVHTVLATYLTTAFIVAGVGAWHLLRGRNNEPVRVMFSMAMWMALLVAPLQIFAGDLHGLNTLEHQPAKIAAMEGHFETRRGAPFYVVGLPDMAAGETKYAISIPYFSSLILTHSFDGSVPGLKSFPRADWPNATVVFWTFRIMVGLGTAMALMGLISGWLRWRGRLYDTRWFAKAAIWMAPSGLIAVIAGWVTTEMGRQPWIVHGLLRTVDAASPINAQAVGATLIAFILVYFTVFGAGIFYLLRLMSRPPKQGEHDLEPGEIFRSAGITPVAATEAAENAATPKGQTP